MTARSLFCLALILACTEINGWHAKFFPRLRSATIQQFSTQSKNFLSSNGKFNLLKTKSNSPLKFKVSESEEEADVDDEIIEFDDIGGSPILRKLSKGKMTTLERDNSMINFRVTSLPA